MEKKSKIAYESPYVTKVSVVMEGTVCASITDDSHHKSEATATEQSYVEYDFNETTGGNNTANEWE